jgi:hypothetical protein
MKFRALLWASFLVLLVVVPAFSQRAKRTVTNQDLEKYRQQRLKAERDYAENYAKMGFPSPEELQKQIEKSRVEREALAARLAAERIQREQIEAELAEAARLSQEGGDIYIVTDGGGGYYGWPSGGFFFDGRFPRGRQIRWPNRVGNGQPIVDYFSPRTFSPRFPAFRRGRR